MAGVACWAIFLDDLTYFEQQGGQWRFQQTGDRHKKQSQGCPDDLYCFRLSEFDGTSATVYLKVKTAGVRRVHTEVLAADQVIPSALGRIQSMTVSLTLSLTIMVLSLVFLFFERALLLKVFSGFQLTVVLAIAANTGVLAQWTPWLSGELRNDLVHLNTVIRIALMVVLGWVALRSLSPSPLYAQAVVLMLVLCGVNLVGVLTPYSISNS